MNVGAIMPHDPDLRDVKKSLKSHQDEKDSQKSSAKADDVNYKSN
jgi:hypothetical protein